MTNDLIKELNSILAIYGDGDCFENVEQYIDLLEQKFPFEGSKIDWDSLSSSESRKIDLNSFMIEGVKFCREMGQKYSISKKDKIIVFGDNAMEFGVRATFEALEEILGIILDLPQHTYVLHESAEWCMVFEMEGYADFAFSNAVADERN